MSRDFYTEAMPYEWFICRAHNCSRQIRNGADVSFMRNLMMAEVGHSAVSHLPKYSKQLETVKMYINKAFDKCIKIKLNESDSELIRQLKTRLDLAQSTSVLMEIVNEGLQLTSNFKES